MSRIRALTFALLTLSPTAALADSLFDVNTLVRTRMIADLEAAPSGDFVVVRVSEYAGGERWQSDYHQVWSNGATVRLTTTGKHYGSYAIAPDGKAMVFAGDRDGKEGLYILPLERGEARLLAEIPVDIDNLRWTRGGIFFTAMVSPSCAERHDFACTRKKLDEHKGTTSALVFDTIGHRPWNMWRDGTVSNLFAIDPATRRVEPVATGNFDIPMVPLGGKEDYVASEDGRTVIYAAKEGATHALTTNHDLYEVTRGPDGGPFGAPKKLTPNKGADTQPVLSPDGTKVAYLAQAREYLESDLWRLHVLDRKTGKTFTLADKLDRWVSAVSYGHDGRLYLHYETGGYHPLASIEATEGAELRDEATKIVVRKLAATPKTVWYTRESMTTPVPMPLTSREAAAVLPAATGSVTDFCP